MRTKLILTCPECGGMALSEMDDGYIRCGSCPAVVPPSKIERIPNTDYQDNLKRKRDSNATT